MIRLVIALGIMATIICPVSAISVNDTADMLHTNILTDWAYVNAVNNYVKDNIRYYTNHGWLVKTPEITLQDKTGDCSEIAVLKTAMLQRHGIDAHVVHGKIPGGLHDTVEIHIGGYRNIIDRWYYPTFEKMGDGLHPSEHYLGGRYPY